MAPQPVDFATVRLYHLRSWKGAMAELGQMFEWDSLYHLRSWKGAMALKAQHSSGHAIIPSEELEGCNGVRQHDLAMLADYTI